MRKHGFAALIPRVDDSASTLRGKPIARSRIPLEVAAMNAFHALALGIGRLLCPGP